MHKFKEKWERRKDTITIKELKIIKCQSISVQRK